MPDGNNLTIDFNDASFDTSQGDVQPVPNIDVDVVFPLDDNPDLTVASGASDNRTSTAAPASAIALMPTDGMSSSMEEFLFEFDNDLNDDGTADDQGLKVTTSGGSGSQQVVNEINLQGTLENLHTDGSLDIYVSDKDANGNQVFETVTLGEGSDTSGNDNITYVGGDTNGGDTGAGDDIASINVDASATMGGTFLGGAGYDMIKLVEGVDQDNGAEVDFTFGPVDGNSAAVFNFGGVGDGMSFDIDEFESVQLTDNADVIFIASDTGESLTNTYDAAYLNGGGSNSMMKVQTGFTDGGMADVMYVHADSNVYLSFEFANESGLGVEATFGANGDVDVDGHIHGSASAVGTDGEVIEVDVNQSGGAGSMTIDYFEATRNHDMITNLGDIGITVDLGGSDDGMADVFTGSSKSDNDVLDAREAHSLEFAEGANGYIQVTGESEVTGSKGVIVNAELKDVDFIMVRDASPADDVDFYQDMSDLNGKQVISGLGDGATDAYGVGYDVVTSAQVDTFGSGSDMRVYYEGKHSDFVDTDDIVLGTEGVFDMSASKSDRGSNWEGEVLSQYGPGQDPGFYIEVSGKKLAVTFDEEKGTNGEWKVDSSALKVAEGVDTITTPSDPDQFASDVMARYGLKPAAEGASSAISGITRDVDVTTTSTVTTNFYLPANLQYMTGITADTSGSFSLPATNIAFAFEENVSGALEVNMYDASDNYKLLDTNIPVNNPSAWSFAEVDGFMSGHESHSITNNFTNVSTASSTAASQGANHSFSDDIYLNATEEAITELLATGTASDKSFNFGFYTKMDLETDTGTVTVNLKLQDTVQSQVDTWLSSNPAPVIAEAIPEVTNTQYQAYQDLVEARDNAFKATQDFNGGLGDPGDTPQAGGTTQSVWENLIQHGNLPTRMSNQTTDTDQLTIAVDGVETLLSDIYVSHVRGDSTETSSGIANGGMYSEGGLVGNVFGGGSYAAIYAIKDPNANDGSMIQIFPEDFTWDLDSSKLDRWNSDWGLNPFGYMRDTANDVSFSTTPLTGHATEWVLVNQGNSRSQDGGNAADIPYANHRYHTIYNDGSLLTPGTGASEMPKASVVTPEITPQMISDYNQLEEALENAENALAGVSDPGSVRDAVAAVTQDDIDAHMANAPAPSYSFVLDASDIDVAVESFYNVAEDAGAGVTSSSAAGEFVKIDNSADIALGNGGDDTYVVGADAGIYGGVALEYGNIGVRGGLTGSIDAVNINSVSSVDDLTFRRGEFRNEEEGNTLFIGDGNGQETVLFDNYNEYLDFRRVEYLTVEDGANNNEIFEIVTNTNLGWDNEIYVTDGGQTNIELGGLDYVIGSTKADEFVIDLSDLIGEGKSGTVNLSGIDASDTITVNDDGALGEADEAELAATLSAAVTGVASTDGEATISFSYSNDKLTLNVDTAMDELDIINREFDHLASS